MVAAIAKTFGSFSCFFMLHCVMFLFFYYMTWYISPVNEKTIQCYCLWFHYLSQDIHRRVIPVIMRIMQPESSLASFLTFAFQKPKTVQVPKRLTVISSVFCKICFLFLFLPQSENMKFLLRLFLIP